MMNLLKVKRARKKQIEMIDPQETVRMEMIMSATSFMEH